MSSLWKHLLGAILMRSKFNNSDIILLGYLAINCVMVLNDLTFTSLGDYRLYIVDRYNPLTINSPERFVQFVYTFLAPFDQNLTLFGIFLAAWLLGLFQSKKNFQHIALTILLLNPVVMSFLLSPSKEALLSLAVAFYIIGGPRRRLLAFFITAATRPLGLVLMLPFLRASSRVTIITGCFIALFLLVTYDIFSSLTIVDACWESTENILRNAFFGYSSETNRYWLPETGRFVQLETLYLLVIGGVSFFLPFTLGWPHITALMIPVAVAKFAALVKFYRYFGLTGVLFLLAYGVPLSIYNAGSALRYTVPINVILVLFLFHRGGVCKYRSIWIGKKV